MGGGKFVFLFDEKKMIKNEGILVATTPTIESKIMRQSQPLPDENDQAYRTITAQESEGQEIFNTKMKHTQTVTISSKRVVIDANEKDGLHHSYVCRRSLWLRGGSSYPLESVGSLIVSRVRPRRPAAARRPSTDFDRCASRYHDAYAGPLTFDNFVTGQPNEDDFQCGDLNRFVCEFA